MATQIHWLLFLALSLMIYWYFFSFLSAETAYFFKIWEYGTEIKALHYILLFPFSFSRLFHCTIITRQQKKASSNCSGKLEVVSVWSQKPGVELTNSCLLEWSCFQHFLIYIFCADYYIANLTSLATGQFLLCLLHTETPRTSYWVPGRKECLTKTLYFS